MKTKIILIGLALCLGLTGCKKENHNPLACNTFMIEYKKGSGMMYNSRAATIDQTGLLRITWMGLTLNNVSDYQITDTELALVRKNLGEVTTMNLKDEYIGISSATDQPSTSLKYIADGRKDSTLILKPDPYQVPDKLGELIATIENTINTNDTVNKR